MPDLLTHRSRTHGDHVAVETPTERITYHELLGRVEARAQDLVAQGLKPGDRVGVRLPNGAAFVETVHAAMRLGLVLVPFNERLTEREREWQMARAKPRHLVTEATRATGGGMLPEDFGAGWDAPQGILFTSGTTGMAKGAVLTHRNHLMSAALSAVRLPVRATDRWLAPIPLYHVGGISVLYRTALAGACAMIPERFDADAANRWIDGGATLVSLVPTMLHRILDARAGRPFPDSLRAVLLGGASASPDLVARARRAGARISTTYGLTEAASQVATLEPGRVPVDPAAVGPPLPGVVVRILSPDAEGIGEITVRGPTVMREYHGEPEATANAVRKGWLHTGDLGRMDEEGNLIVVARRSDLIVTGGENVYPAEVEAALVRHPAVADACVVALPHHVWGHTVAAVLVPVDGASLDVADVIAHTRLTLAGYKIPRDVVVLDHLPVTSSGKVSRDAVADMVARHETTPT